MSSSCYDILIKEALIVDGSGSPFIRGDIGISDGKISRLGLDLGNCAETVINANRLIVSPGFIDMHSHGDYTLLAMPRAESSVLQGVTTVVIGNCGNSLAPITKKNFELFKNFMSPSLVQGYDYGWDWRSTKEFAEKLERRGISVNVVMLTGHNTIRIAVKGLDSSPPTKNELEEMKELLRESIEQGSWGLSTGLIYVPGSYSNKEEIMELAKVLKEFHKRLIYSTHMRNEGKYLLESVEEAIEIGEKAGVPVHISHLKASGKSNWGKVVAALRLMSRARERGVDITCDVYPYTAGSTRITAILPDWVIEGGLDNTLKRLSDPSTREKIMRDIEEDRMRNENFIKSCGWDNIYIARCPAYKEFEGKSLRDILYGLGDIYENFFNFLVKVQLNAYIVIFYGDEEDVEAVLKHPLSCVGSDSSPISPEFGGKPHPRAYGTFPRVLGRYVRERRLITIEEAIRKMTSMPATKLGISDRGLIRQGFFADLVIFDPNKVIDNATFGDPHRYPSGINYVIVNGQIVVDQGVHTNKFPGKVLRSQPYK
ncbi:MAG: D-aminoacylase [Desulfurococcaceae archaeon]